MKEIDKDELTDERESLVERALQSAREADDAFADYKASAEAFRRIQSEAPCDSAESVSALRDLARADKKSVRANQRADALKREMDFAYRREREVEALEEKTRVSAYAVIVFITCMFAPISGLVFALIWVVAAFSGAPNRATTTDKWIAAIGITPGLFVWAALFLTVALGMEGSYGQTLVVVPFWIGLPLLLWAIAPKKPK